MPAPRSPAPGRRPVRLLIPLLIGAGCGSIADDPTGDERPFVPDRAVAPWRLAPLTVCADPGCDPARVPSLASLDVLWPGAEPFVVAAGLSDGSLRLGDLTEGPEGWVLSLDPKPALLPGAPWHGAALRHPDLVATGDPAAPLGVCFGVADGQSLGWAAGSRHDLHAQPTPLASAASLGADAVGEPSAVRIGDELVVAFRVGATAPATIATAAGPWGQPVSGPLPALDASAFDDDGVGWGPLSDLGHPDLGATADGLLRMFFTGRGSWAFDADSEPTAANDSIGYAAGPARDQLEPYPHNPVHNRTYNFLFEADERGGAVAVGDEVAVLVYLEALGGATQPALAVHELGR